MHIKSIAKLIDVKNSKLASLERANNDELALLYNKIKEISNINEDIEEDSVSESSDENMEPDLALLMRGNQDLIKLSDYKWGCITSEICGFKSREGRFRGMNIRYVAGKDIKSFALGYWLWQKMQLDGEFYTEDTDGYILDWMDITPHGENQDFCISDGLLYETDVVGVDYQETYWSEGGVDGIFPTNEIGRHNIYCFELNTFFPRINGGSKTQLKLCTVLEQIANEEVEEDIEYLKYDNEIIDELLSIDINSKSISELVDHIKNLYTKLHQ